MNNMMNFKKDSVNPIMLLIENLGEISILADEVVDNPDVISDNQEREILTDIYGKFMKENMELIIEITKNSGQEEGYKNVEEISKFFYKRLNKLKTDAVVKRQEKSIVAILSHRLPNGLKQQKLMELAEEIMQKNGDKKGARINDVGYLRKRILFTAMDKGFVPPHSTEEVGDTGDEER